MTDNVVKNIALCEYMGNEYQKIKDISFIADFRNVIIDYSCDWNLIIPVAKKLAEGYPFGNKFFDKQNEYQHKISIALQSFDIDALFNACYNFITLIKQINK